MTASGEKTTLKARGRHDHCVVPRAVPIVEAMAAMVILDLLLIAESEHLRLAIPFIRSMMIFWQNTLTVRSRK